MSAKSRTLKGLAPLQEVEIQQEPTGTTHVRIAGVEVLTVSFKQVFDRGTGERTRIDWSAKTRAGMLGVSDSPMEFYGTIDVQKPKGAKR
jgi:hypothetical protein